MALIARIPVLIIMDGPWDLNQLLHLPRQLPLSRNQTGLLGDTPVARIAVALQIAVILGPPWCARNIALVLSYLRMLSVPFSFDMV